MGTERRDSVDAQKRSTGLVAVRGVAKMGVVVAHFMVVGRWCSSNALSNRQNKDQSLHINRMAGQNPTCI